MLTATGKDWGPFIAANWPLDELGESRLGRRGYDAPFQRAILDNAHPKDGWPTDSIAIDEGVALDVIARARAKLAKERRRTRPQKGGRRISTIERSRKSLKGAIGSINDVVWAAAHKTPEKCAIYVIHACGAYSRSHYKVFIIVRPSAVAAAFRARQRYKRHARTSMVRKAIAYAIHDDKNATSNEREIAAFLEPVPDAATRFEARTGDISVSVSLGLPASAERQLFVDSMATLELGPRLVIRLRRGEGMDAQKIARVMGESPVREVVSILTAAEAAIRDAVSRTSNG